MLSADHPKQAGSDWTTLVRNTCQWPCLHCEIKLLSLMEELVLGTVPQLFPAKPTGSQLVRCCLASVTLRKSTGSPEGIGPLYSFLSSEKELSRLCDEETPRGHREGTFPPAAILLASLGPYNFSFCLKGGMISFLEKTWGE